MKTKLITTLTALLMLVGISAQAQTDNQTPVNAESTGLEGDLNHDNKVDVADVTYLVNLIMKNKSEAKDGTYYWYIGTENPSSISNIQTDNTVAGWHEIGSSLDGFSITFNNANLIEFEEPTQYYVTIPNDLYIYNSVNIKWEDRDDIFTSEACNIPGYKAFRYHTGVWDVKGIIIKGYKTKYFWYAGADMLTSETVPGSDTVFPMVTTSEDQIGWHQIKGMPSSIATGSLNNGEQINWVLAVPTTYGLTRISNGEDVTDAYDVSTVTAKDGIEYTVFKQKSATQRIDCSFVEGGTKYYWYIGAENPTSISDIQSDNTVAGWHEIGTSTFDFRLDTSYKNNRVELLERVKYCVVIPNHLHIYDAANRNTESLYFTSEACNIPGYKAFRYNTSSDGVWDVKGIIIKENDD